MNYRFYKTKNKVITDKDGEEYIAEERFDTCWELHLEAERKGLIKGSFLKNHTISDFLRLSTFLGVEEFYNELLSQKGGNSSQG